MNRSQVVAFPDHLMVPHKDRKPAQCPRHRGASFIAALSGPDLSPVLKTVRAAEVKLPPPTSEKQLAVTKQANSRRRTPVTSMWYSGPLKVFRKRSWRHDGPPSGPVANDCLSQ